MLIRKTILTLIICSLLVMVCAYYIDKPLTIWCYAHEFHEHNIFLELALIPDILMVFLISGMIYTLFLKHYNEFMFLLVILLNIVSAIMLCHGLKWVFGRVDPTIWLSYYHKDIDYYGFYFFNFGLIDFPSGHSTAIFAGTSIIWCTYPKLRWLCYLLCGIVIFSLIVMHYHFLGSCIAGAGLGYLMGLYTYSLLLTNDKIKIFKFIG